MSDTKLPIEFKPSTTAVVPVSYSMTAKEKAQARKRQLSEQLADAKAYEALGAKIVKISANTAKKLGDEMKSLGIQSIGHGRMFLAGEHSLMSIGKCDDIITKLLEADPPVDPDKIVGLMQIKLGFTKLLLDSGEAHIKATKQAEPPPSDGNKLTVPFPSNQKMVVQVASIPNTPLPNG